MATFSPSALLEALAARFGEKGFTADPDAMAPWLTDWRGRYHGAAAALVSPADSAEAADIVRLCAEARIAIVPQGGNTSMVGGATPDASGTAIIMSLRRMNAIRSLGPDGALCEAGVILQTLHEAAAASGLRFPLTLGARGSATVGGLISTNAGGTQVLRFGTMRALVQGIEAVLPDGSIHHGLAPLKKDNRGYDLKHLLIGAEGTLGIVTVANLRLVPAIGSRAVAWAGLSDAEDALALLRLLEARMGDAVEGFELVPRIALDLVTRNIDGARAPLAESHAWNVLIEATAPQGAAPPDDALAAALGEALESGLVADVVIASSEKQAESLWRLRDSISEAERHHGPGAKHDVSVPVAAMPEFIAKTTAAVEARFPGTQVIAFGHLGDGNVHFNVAAPRGADAGWIAGAAPEITAFVHDCTVAAGGSISAEHGIGQMRLGELARLSDPARIAALRAIKRALDPHDIMNPGKLVPPSGDAQESLA